MKFARPAPHAGQTLRGRLRSLAAGWLVVRLVASFLFVVDAAVTLAQLREHQLVSQEAAVEWMQQLACLVLVWSPRLGLWMGLLALGWSFAASPDDENNSTLAVMAIVLIPWLRRPLHVAGLALALVVYAVGFTFVSSPPDTLAGDLVMRLVTVILASMVGLAARWFLIQHRAGQARIERLEEENRRIRADERAALARELHDVVAHQLSVTTLQVMGHRQSRDVDELHRALDRIDDATRAALGELRVLVGVLRDLDDEWNLPDVTDATSPAELVGVLSDTLREHGFHPTLQVHTDLNALDASEQRTLARVLQEATTNILRNAPDGSDCDLLVETAPGVLHVRVTNEMPAEGSTPRLAGQSMGYGLRGIRERVDLSGGWLQAGPVDGHWVLEMELPRVGVPAHRTPNT